MSSEPTMSSISYRTYRTYLALMIAAALPALLSASTAGAQSRLDPKREAVAIEFLTNGIPEHAEHLRELKRERPEENYQEHERGLQEQAEVDRARDEEPERYGWLLAERKLDKRCFDLARQIRHGGGGEAQQSLERELEQAVAELFDLRESWRKQEIEMLEGELERLRGEGEQRLRHRDEILRRRIEELTGLAELYAW